MVLLRLLSATPFRTVFDDPPPADDTDAAEAAAAAIATAAAAAAATDDKKTKVKVVFTPEQQAYVNSLVAEERRKGKATADLAITKLETERNRANTTAAEKEALDIRIEELRATQMTQEELRKKDDAKKTRKSQEELDAAKKEAAAWQNRFTKSTIQREIIQAASLPAHKAHNPKHVVNELEPLTRLVEELDPEGKPTGNLVPKIKLTTKDKDNKPVTLDMTVTEAVKWMSEQDEHDSLFISGATGGLGGNSGSQRRGGNADEAPTDPAEYVEWRKKKNNRGKK